MSHFIFMLTKNDQTVANAHAVYASIAKSNLRYIGFKDIGLPFEELVSLAKKMKQDGKTVMLEVVSENREAELRSIDAAARIGVDYLLGGRRAEDAIRMLKGTGIQYFPFAGHTVGHPTQLTGTQEEVVEDAKRLASMPGVFGLDLLAYRFKGDAPELTRRVVQAVKLPVIAAGSIDCNQRVQAMRAAGAWGFTVGSAIFDGSFLGDPVHRQINTILNFEGVSA
jgi:pyridoxal biosynthesis lyase PdxS